MENNILNEFDTNSNNLAIRDPNSLFIRSNSTQQNNSTMNQNKPTKFDGNFFKNTKSNSNQFQPFKTHAFTRSDKVVTIDDNGQLPVINDLNSNLRKSVFVKSHFNNDVSPKIFAGNNSRTSKDYLDPKFQFQNSSNYLNTADKLNLSKHQENNSDHCIFKEFGVNISLLREIDNFFLNFPNRSYSDVNQYYQGKSKDEFNTFYNELKQQKSSFEKYIDDINVFQDTGRKYIDTMNDLTPTYGDSQSKSTNAIKHLSVVENSISYRNMNMPRKSLYVSKTPSNKLFENSCANFSKMVDNYKRETKLKDLITQSKSSMNIVTHDSMNTHTRTNMQLINKVTKFNTGFISQRNEKPTQFIRRSSNNIPQNDRPAPQNQDSSNNNYRKKSTGDILKIEKEWPKEDELQKASMGAFSDEESDNEIIETKEELPNKHKNESLYDLPKKYQKVPLREQGLHIFAIGLKKMIERTYQSYAITNDMMKTIFTKPLETFSEFIEDKNMVLQQKKIFSDMLGTESEGIDDKSYLLNSLSPDKPIGEKIRQKFALSLEKCETTKNKNYRVKHTKGSSRTPRANKGPSK